MSEEILLDLPLVPDPDADQEMGAADVQAIADEDLQGSRLLLVLRAVESVDLDGVPGVAVQLACTFQPALDARFRWARLLLTLTTPAGVQFLDVGPEAVKEGEPVRFTVDEKGKLGIKYVPLSAESVQAEQKQYSLYHCTVQGTGAGTAMARWDFRENPHTENGLGQQQSLTFTLPYTGKITAEVRTATKIVRGGMGGIVQRVRDLVLGNEPNSYEITLELSRRPKSPEGQSFVRA